MIYSTAAYFWSPKSAEAHRRQDQRMARLMCYLGALR